MYFSGAGGMMSTAEDYLQFAQMMLNGGELNGRRYLSPQTMALMTSNHTGDMVNGQFGRPPRGMGFGLSMQVVMDPIAADLRVSKGRTAGRGHRRQLLGRAGRAARLDLFRPGRIGRPDARRRRERDPTGDHQLRVQRPTSNSQLPRTLEVGCWELGS